MDMIEHTLFPTLIGEFSFDQASQFKIDFFEHIFDHMDPEGFSSEFTGHVTLHHEPSFSPLFVFATQAVRKYIARLHIDPELFDVNIVKTWMNITRNRSTPTHSHADAHMSFTYYINVPETVIKPLRFYNHIARHEPFPGCIKFNKPSTWDWINAYTWQFLPKEGDMFVFPASLPHDTVSQQEEQETGCKTVDDLKMTRICLAGDVVLTHRDLSNTAMGLQPIRNWRNFG
jgi:hypothetical protein